MPDFGGPPPPNLATYLIVRSGMRHAVGVQGSHTRPARRGLESHIVGSSTIMGIEHVWSTVILRNFLRGGGRERHVRPGRVLGEFIAAMCLLLLLAIAVIGGLLALFQWVTLSLPPSLLLSCPAVEGCARPAARPVPAEHHQVLFDQSPDAPHVVP
jgi:hypothetical protein